jgi:hypothetical protein
MDVKNIEAMIYLLDDNDQEVVQQIENQLLELGTPVIPILEDQWNRENLTALHHERIYELMDKIRLSSSLGEIEKWKNDESNDILEGCFILSRIFFPEVELETIEKEIEQIRLDVWLQMSNTLSAWERVRILNDVFFVKFKYKGDRDNYHEPENSFIHKVIERKKGNPISLSVLYLSVAQRLNLPIFGVNLPQHFVLAFMPSDFDESTGDFSQKFEMNYKSFPGEPLFYLDVFSEGLPFDRDRVNSFLKEVNIEPREQYYHPCSNVEILKRVVRNLIHSYEQKEKPKKLELLNNIMNTLNASDES